jgi:hypothetical protein
VSAAPSKLVLAAQRALAKLDFVLTPDGVAEQQRGKRSNTTSATTDVPYVAISRAPSCGN